MDPDTNYIEDSKWVQWAVDDGTRLAQVVPPFNPLKTAPDTSVSLSVLARTGRGLVNRCVKTSGGFLPPGLG